MIRRLVALFVPLVLVIAACGDGDDGDATESAESATATTTTTTTTTTTVAVAGGASGTAPSSTPPSTPSTTAAPEEAPDTSAATTSVPVTTEPEPEPEPEAGGNCLVGDWVVNEAEMNRFYDAMQADIDGIEFTVTGQTFLSFTDDTYEWRPEFTLVLSMSGIGGSGTAGGNITGSYELVDGVVTTSSEVNAVTLAIEVAGQQIDGSAMENQLLDSVPINSAPVDCSGPTPVIDFTTPTGSIPISLTPA